jgi:hypothetical protein
MREMVVCSREDTTYDTNQADYNAQPGRTARTGSIYENRETERQISEAGSRYSCPGHFGRPDAEADVARHIGVSRQTVRNVKKDFETAADLNAFLCRKKREVPPVPPKVTGELEARVIALACGTPPAGHAAWTLRLLADICVELQYIDSLSHMTVSRLLKKHNLNLI